ncbi:MAG: spondin domain-containing protein [Phycisphaerales bacterium]
MRTTSAAIACALIGAGLASNARSAELTVTIESLAPTGGTFLAPFWFGFHDGSFDLFDPGSAAAGHIERLAEDGAVDPLRTAFANASGQFRDGTIAGLGGAFAGPLDPGEIASTTITVDATNGRWFSYAAMLVPSNDAFIGNANPLAHEAFDVNGNFNPFSFIVLGSQVWDAGTEMNDEVPANTAFFGQSTPDTGVDENGVVHAHPGFIPGGAILSDPMFANADFTASGYQVLRVTVVPTPGVGALLALGGLAGARRRR